MKIPPKKNRQSYQFAADFIGPPCRRYISLFLFLSFTSDEKVVNSCKTMNWLFLMSTEKWKKVLATVYFLFFFFLCKSDVKSWILIMIGIEDVLSQKKAEITDSKLYQPHSIWMLPITNLSYIYINSILGTTKRNELSCCVSLEAILHYVNRFKCATGCNICIFNFTAAWQKIERKAGSDSFFLFTHSLTCQPNC